MALEAIRCPSKRFRSSKGNVLCNGLVIISDGFAYCPKCGIFYEVERDGDIVLIKKTDKKNIKFKFLIFRYSE